MLRVNGEFGDPSRCIAATALENSTCNLHRVQSLIGNTETLLGQKIHLLKNTKTEDKRWRCGATHRHTSGSGCSIEKFPSTSAGNVVMECSFRSAKDSERVHLSEVKEAFHNVNESFSVFGRLFVLLKHVP